MHSLSCATSLVTCSLFNLGACWLEAFFELVNQLLERLLSSGSADPSYRSHREAVVPVAVTGQRGADIG